VSKREESMPSTYNSEMWDARVNECGIAMMPLFFHLYRIAKGVRVDKTALIYYNFALRIWLVYSCVLYIPFSKGFFVHVEIKLLCRGGKKKLCPLSPIGLTRGY
jgi:hypothetical protein